MPNSTQHDGLYTFAGKNYKKVKGNWYKETNEDAGNYMPIKKGNVASRIATLEKNAQSYKNMPSTNPLNLEPIQLSNNTILGDMMNIPQNIAVSALTGNKYTTPSDYLKGEKITDNSYVGAAADLVLDPMNLLLMKNISPYDKITPAYNKAVKWNKVVEPTIKFDLLTKPTTIEHANGGFVNPKGWPPPTSKGVSISDLKEYAYRKSMYDDSLKLYNKYPAPSQWDKAIGKIWPYTNKKNATTHAKHFNLENKILPIGENPYKATKINGVLVHNPVYKKPVQPINKSGEEPTDPYAHSKTKVTPKVIGVPPDQNEDPTKKYVGANEEMGYDENGNPISSIEHIYETNKLTRGLKSESNKNEIVPLTSRKSNEPSKSDFAYRDQAVYEYDKDTKKFNKDSSRKAPLPYAERYSKGWESNTSKDIPESGPRAWTINGAEYYNQEDANAAARQYEQIPSYNFVDGGPLNDKTNHGEILNSVYASALGNYYNKGGMLKRADGSYSPRGLWDNIRANAGSGKAPTKEMLAQERKINNYADGGQFQGKYSLPEDSFRQGGKNLHDSIYASSPQQYPGIYKSGGNLDDRQQMYMPLDHVTRNGGSILSMSNTPEMSGEGKDLTYPENSYAYDNGGPLYTYAGRPGAQYQKDTQGNWLINTSGGTDFTPIKDPTGKRSAILNKNATIYTNPAKFKREYDPLLDVTAALANP